MYMNVLKQRSVKAVVIGYLNCCYCCVCFVCVFCLFCCCCLLLVCFGCVGFFFFFFFFFGGGGVLFSKPELQRTKKEGHFYLNDELNTFYLRLHGVRYIW